MPTDKTITNDQIAALRDEASHAGDVKQADLCRLALGRSTVMTWHITPLAARQLCADAINAARAQPNCQCGTPGIVQCDQHGPTE